MTDSLTIAPRTSELSATVTQAWRRFLEIYEPLRPALYRFCRYLSRSPWDAEDLVQDTLARAFATPGGLNEPPRDPRAWLFRVASNLWIDQVRRRGVGPDSAATAATAASAGPDPTTPGRWRRSPAAATPARPRARCWYSCPRRSARPSCSRMPRELAGRDLPRWRSDRQAPQLLRYARGHRRAVRRARPAVPDQRHLSRARHRMRSSLRWASPWRATCALVPLVVHRAPWVDPCARERAFVPISVRNLACSAVVTDRWQHQNAPRLSKS
jgi:hypothetical protein